MLAFCALGRGPPQVPWRVSQGVVSKGGAGGAQGQQGTEQALCILLPPTGSSRKHTCAERRERSLLWIKLSLKAMLWLVWSSIQNTKTFSRSVIRLFHFLIIHVFIGVHFLQELFLCIYNLADCHRRPSFGSVLALDMLSSLSLIISSFWFKMRDVRLFLSLKHIEAIVVLLTGLNSRFMCLGE